MYFVSSEITEKIFILKYHSTSMTYIKIMLYRVHVNFFLFFSFFPFLFLLFIFFVIADQKSFSWCNVIQQIKNLA